MESRNQFTFYRSFWDAVLDLPEEDKLVVLQAIIQYALDGEVSEQLSSYRSSCFKLCKPTLDTARKKAKAMKAERAKKSGQDQEIEIENEIEIETEKEKEKEKEGNLEFPNPREREFESFWQLYPRKEGKMKAKMAYIKSDVGLSVILGALGRQLSCEQWQQENGRFIPLPATWLNQRRWEDEPAPVSQGRRPDAQEIAAVRRLMENG